MYMVGHDMSSISVGTSRRCIDGSKRDVSLHTYRFKVIFVLFRYIHSHSCI